MEQPGTEAPSLDPVTARVLAQDAFIFGAPLVLVSLQADYLSATERFRSRQQQRPAWLRRR